MPNSRRRFLKRLAVGTFGLAGVLLPEKLWACWRGRRTTECCPPSSPSLHTYAGPSGEFYCYYPDGTHVVGGGRFFVWGVSNTGVTPDATATFALGGTNYTGNAVTPLPAHLTPGGWCYAFDSVPTGAAGTLKVTGKLPTGGNAAPGAWANIFVY